jgi:hypothetical protein
MEFDHSSVQLRHYCAAKLISLRRKCQLLSALAVVAALFLLPTILSGAATSNQVIIAPGPQWKILSMFSGKNNYYSVMAEAGTDFIRAEYEPGQDTAILYRQLDHPGLYAKLQWKWRVLKFPVGANESIEGRRDSAAAVYVYFQTTFKKYVIKYVWSLVLPEGYNYRDADSNYLQKLHIVVLRGPPPKTDLWLDAQANPVEDFKRYYGDCVDPNDIPPIAGIGILTDGDGTGSYVVADYAGFRLFR